MEIALFKLDGFMFVLRLAHVFFGIVWIGLLYYFNFVQGAFMNDAATTAETKNAAFRLLVPRALWWFRWAAFWTATIGIVYLGLMDKTQGHEIWKSAYGVSTLTGSLLGLIMATNVWFVIWPNQKVLIANAETTFKGGAANPAAAASGAKAGLASRTNVLFSIPMLFGMLSARHLAVATDENSQFGMYFLFLLVIAGAIELNALKGKMGPLATVKGVIHMGFVLAAVIYAGMEFFL
jgi:uncharacterized membrane protein